MNHKLTYLFDQIGSRLKGDRVIWGIVIVLCIFSLLTVYSASGTLAFRQQDGFTEYYLIKHFILLCAGLGIMYAAHTVKYTYYSRIAQILLIIVIPLLLFTLLFGTSVNNANRWLLLPGGFSFQPSDLAKLALITYIARIVSKKQKHLHNFKSTFFLIMLPVIVVCGLILPANFSTAALLFFTSVVIMLIGRVKLAHIASLFGIGFVGLTLMVALSFAVPGLLPRMDTWINRVETFMGDEEHMDRDSRYQIEQAKMAIATGGITGKGPGNSTQRIMLPQSSSDFIYAITIEEYGLFGGVTLIMLYLILMYRVARIATRASNIFGMMLVIGCGFSMVFQAMINMAVTVNLLPTTGQPLPLISMGGTSIWFTCIMIGIILSVSKAVEKESDGVSVKKGNYAVT